jgi:hypothetical protein
MSAYVIVVDFRVNEGAKPEFRRPIDVNAGTPAGMSRLSPLRRSRIS